MGNQGSGRKEGGNNATKAATNNIDFLLVLQIALSDLFGTTKIRMCDILLDISVHENATIR